MALIDNIITHWNINQDRGYGNDDFTALLNEFKFNLEKNITFLDFQAARTSDHPT